MDIEKIVQKQRDYYNLGHTRELVNRVNALKTLKRELKKYMPKFEEAFKIDYNKCSFDVLTTEAGMVMKELSYMLRHIKGLSRPKRKRTSLLNFPAKARSYADPYGNVLIVSPWNYPLQLSLVPLIGAIAGGNTVVLKPSNYVPTVSQTLKEMLSCFDERFVSVVLGGREQNQALFDQKFDFIFFTGGIDVGRIVLEKAAVHTTPVVLELGGKSPCIVDKDANLDISAKRIVWGKFLNAGQTCVAPDYICVHKDVHDEFVEKVKAEIVKNYYVDSTITPTFPFVITDKHVTRLQGYIDDKKLVAGGRVEGRLMEPTVLDKVTFNDAVMQEEIFGPIMPIIVFDDLEKLLKTINEKPKPLAFYYFGENKEKQRYVVESMRFGGGCVNDVIMHLTEEALPFGGVGESGIGAYHGKRSFETFTHQKCVLFKGRHELSLKYPPYTTKKERLAKRFFKL